jgi:pantoate--beta-alanine ligase
VREPDGLALSSRNAYLSRPDRKAATVLYRALTLARSMRTDGVADAEAIRRTMRSLIEDEPLAQIDYVSVADQDTLEELDEVEDGALASLAVRIGGTRLIDNVTLEGSKSL